MTREEFQDFTRGFMGEQMRVLDGKGASYAGDADALSNFKKLSKEVDIPPMKVWHVYVAKHMQSIASIIGGGSGGGESVRSRFIDAANYLILGLALYEDSGRQSVVVIDEEDPA